MSFMTNGDDVQFSSTRALVLMLPSSCIYISFSTCCYILSRDIYEDDWLYICRAGGDEMTAYMHHRYCSHQRAIYLY